MRKPRRRASAGGEVAAVVHGGEDVVGGDAAVEVGDESAEAVFADQAVDLGVE